MKRSFMGDSADVAASFVEHTLARHESVPEGALPFFIPSAKRARCPGSPRCHAEQLLDHAESLPSSDDERMCDGEPVAVATGAHVAAQSPAVFRPQPDPVRQLQPQLASLGMLCAPACEDATAFLLTLADSLAAAGCSSSGASAGLAHIGTPAWHSIAELNVLMARHFSSLPTSMLRGYHSFTRQPRAQLWSRFAQSQGAPPGHEASFGLGPGTPLQVSLTRVLLEHVLSPCPTASCVVYTMEVPAWLRPWAARWGYPARAPLRVLAVFAYPGADNAAPRVLYVPMAQEL
ncbi:hypothetical protein HYH03_000280 [Edaphochlamys debaryana]|uniref:Uncharacterized protein n=1 Tax=Edaphochlamys debaryana TaxID=47281 RepID=A0A835YFB5_9CHLO|nr:hypothetical protein HYH03_000280 [Edaphochlamys debaryana]|eukprot:KAG2501780.1 hypothetical protein HYH03_000280 [Edaphochlamys debaryana]